MSWMRRMASSTEASSGPMISTSPLLSNCDKKASSVTTHAQAHQRCQAGVPLVRRKLRGAARGAERTLTSVQPDLVRMPVIVRPPGPITMPILLAGTCRCGVACGIQGLGPQQSTAKHLRAHN